MEVTGKIKQLDETKTFGANGFRKREIIVTTDEQYPQHILIEFTQDKCDHLNNFEVGQTVTIKINLKGREWINPQGEIKYFNSIQGWFIERHMGTATNQNSPADAYLNKQKSGPENAGDQFLNNDFKSQEYQGDGDINNLNEEEDDLPF